MHLSTILLAALDSQAAPLPIYTGLGAVQRLETFKGSVNRSLAQLTVHVRIMRATVLSSSVISLYITIFL